MTTDKLQEKLRKNLLYLACQPGGERANLSGANLSGANLFEADLSGANLFKANVKDTNLNGATLIRANLFEADLSGAKLFEAYLKDAHLYGATLIRANLFKADLSGAKLFEANLKDTNLNGANLHGANLKGAKGIHTAGPMRSSGRMLYAVEHKTCLMVQAGCFWGRLDELEQAVKEDHNDAHYHDVIAYFRAIEKRIYS